MAMEKIEFKVGDCVLNKVSGNIGVIVALPYREDYDWLTVRMNSRSGNINIRKWSLKNLELLTKH